MVFPRAKVAVFVDGCFWHGCPEHHTVAKKNADFWAAKVIRNKERDEETTRLLGDLGWTVVRVWEQQLKWTLMSSPQERLPGRPTHSSTSSTPRTVR